HPSPSSPCESTGSPAWPGGTSTRPPCAIRDESPATCGRRWSPPGRSCSAFREIDVHRQLDLDLPRFAGAIVTPDLQVLHARQPLHLFGLSKEREDAQEIALELHRYRDFRIQLAVLRQKRRFDRHAAQRRGPHHRVDVLQKLRDFLLFGKL